MSEQKVKSNAPWILGIIGLALAVPNFVCSVMCSEAAKQFGESNVAIGIVLTLVLFLLSFFGKAKISLITGLVMLVGSLYMIYLNITQLQILGLSEGVVFLFAAIFSMTNVKKAK